MAHHYQPPGYTERRLRDIEMWLGMRGLSLGEVARGVGLHRSTARARVRRLDGLIVRAWAWGWGHGESGDPAWLKRLRAAGAVDLARTWLASEAFESTGEKRGKRK